VKKEPTMIYAILEKDLDTDITEVHSLYENKQDADWTLENLINDMEGYGYKMITIEDNG
jgi:hypothetical protein